MVGDNRRNDVQVFLITSSHGTSITQKRQQIPELGMLAAGLLTERLRAPPSSARF